MAQSMFASHVHAAAAAAEQMGLPRRKEVCNFPPPVEVTRATPVAALPPSIHAHARMTYTKHLFTSRDDVWPPLDAVCQPGYGPSDGWYKLVLSHAASHHGVAYAPPCLAVDPHGWGTFVWDFYGELGIPQTPSAPRTFTRTAGLGFARANDLPAWTREAIDSVARDETAIERAIQMGLLVTPVAVPRGARVSQEEGMARADAVILGTPMTLARFMAERTTLRGALARAAAFTKHGCPATCCGCYNTDSGRAEAMAAIEGVGDAVLDVPLGSVSIEAWARVASAAAAVVLRQTDDATARGGDRLFRRLFEELTTHEMQRAATASEDALLGWLRAHGKYGSSILCATWFKSRAIAEDTWAAYLSASDGSASDGSASDGATALWELASARPADVTPQLVERLVQARGVDWVMAAIASLAGPQCGSEQEATVPPQLRALYIGLRARGGQDPDWLVRMHADDTGVPEYVRNKAAVDAAVAACVAVRETSTITASTMAA